MQGVIDYITGNDPGACKLRDRYVFKIIPMLNPDGVIIGNYRYRALTEFVRCSLSGHDLNRQWITPSSKLHPEIFYSKMMIRKTLDSREMLFYCDFHGHSRNKNLFMYGNIIPRGPDRLKERIFPMLMHKNSDHFNLHDCSFIVQKCKESTARVVMWREFGLINSFTLECSFCGPTGGVYMDCHFTPSILLVRALS